MIQLVTTGAAQASLPIWLLVIIGVVQAVGMFIAAKAVNREKPLWHRMLFILFWWWFLAKFLMTMLRLLVFN